MGQQDDDSADLDDWLDDTSTAPEDDDSDEALDGDESEALKANLLRMGMESLFEDQRFSGELLTRMFKLGLSEEEMDTIYKRAEDDIVNFVNVLEETGAQLDQDGSEALTGFIYRLKRQILKNPALYVEGT